MNFEIVRKGLKELIINTPENISNYEREQALTELCDMSFQKGLKDGKASNINWKLELTDPFVIDVVKHYASMNDKSLFIHTIKLIRHLTECSLVDGKNFVEKYFPRS
jgi:ribosomal protein L7/L12